MKRFHALTKRLFLPALVMAALSGCNSDRYIENIPTEEEDVYLLVELKVPGVSASSTRAFATEGKEKEINEVDVLMFYIDDLTEVETFAYHRQGEPRSNGNYQVKIKKSEVPNDKYRFVFLANLSAEVTAVMNSTTNPIVENATTKEEVLEKIRFDVNAPWNTTTTPLRYLPMWGESEPTTITSDTEDIGTVYMLRSVARVDIWLNPIELPSVSNPNPEINGFDDFKLESVRVYNASQQGVAAPAKDNVKYIYTASMKAFEPTLPSTNSTGMIEYNNLTTEQQAKGLVREIYIAEYANTWEVSGSKTDKPDEDITCLLVSGYYNGSEDPSWYRLDFTDPDNSNRRMDVLRNHCYRFYITSINGPGYPNPDEALNSQLMHINYIYDWSNGTIDDVNIDQQQYELSVSQSEFNLSGRAYEELGEDTDNILTVTTTWPDGCTIKITDSAGGDIDWLSTNPSSETSSGTTQVKLILDDNPVGYGERIGYIHLRAKTLTYKVRVTQAAAS